MSDETRAELRRDVGRLVRWASLPGAFLAPAEVEHDRVDGSYRSVASGVVIPFDSEAALPPEDFPPPLTDLQHLALSVLLGDPAVGGAILVGALEDSGVFPAGAVTAAVEGAVREERAKCVAAAADKMTDCGWGPNTTLHQWVVQAIDPPFRY